MSGHHSAQRGAALFELTLAFVLVLLPIQVGLTLSTAFAQRASIVDAVRVAGRLAGHTTPVSVDPDSELCTIARSSLRNLLDRARIPATIAIESIDLNSSRTLTSMRRVEGMRITVVASESGLGWRLLNSIGYDTTVTGEFLLEASVPVQASAASFDSQC